MASKGIQFPGTNNFKSEPITVINRTGTTVAEGDVLAIDINNTEAESLPMNIFRNAVAPATANMDGIIIVSTTKRVVADNEEFDACISGPVQAKVDGGTLDVAAGDKLIVTNASRSFTRSDATTDIVAARAAEANTGASALKWVYLLPSVMAAGTDESP